MPVPKWTYEVFRASPFTVHPMKGRIQLKSPDSRWREIKRGERTPDEDSYSISDRRADGMKCLRGIGNTERMFLGRRRPVTNRDRNSRRFSHFQSNYLVDRPFRVVVTGGCSLSTIQVCLSAYSTTNNRLTYSTAADSAAILLLHESVY